MAKTEAFDQNYKQYDDWFIRNRNVFLSELNAVKQFIPEEKEGKKILEVGVGTGQFAEPLGIEIGIEPSESMRKVAEKKGIQVTAAAAEAMPFDDCSFDYILMVTTICFLDDPEKAFREIFRVLRSNGTLVLGFVDKESPLGQQYLSYKDKNIFYKDAVFYSVAEVLQLINQHPYKDIEIIQTVFGSISSITQPQDFRSGFEEGGFVVIKSVKDE